MTHAIFFFLIYSVRDLHDFSETYNNRTIIWNRHVQFCHEMKGMAIEGDIPFMKIPIITTFY